MRIKQNRAFPFVPARCQKLQTSVTLTNYIERRLGRTPSAQAVNFFTRPFGSASYAEFWRYWNPVFGYYLSYHCYRPLRKLMPRTVAVLLTFLFCGVLHDLPFGLLAAVAGNKAPPFTMTAMFSLIGLVIIASERVGLSFERLPVALRWVIHASTIYLCWRIGLYLTVAS